jgi:hypothetical protein
MNTKLTNIVSCLAWCLLSFTCRAQDDPAFSTRVAVSISDDAKIPVPNADVLIAYLHAYDGKRDRKHKGPTDAAGQYEANDRVNGSVLVRASKNGYYPLDFDRVVIRMDVDWKKIKNIELPLVMRQIKQPVPLYAKKLSAIVPTYDKPVGFDFEAGDWVAPYGKGKSPDMLLDFDRMLVGYRGDLKYEDMVKDLESIHSDNPRKKETYFNGMEKLYGKMDRSDYRQTININAGKWDSKLSVTFPNPQEGIANAKKDYCHYSELTLPHEAYPEGYSKDLHINTDNHTPKNTPPDPAYFVRTRVALDEKGEIASANYAKITSPIHFDPRGRIEFTYVFNPTPNDRNLEFDTSKNNFANLKFEERVVKP